MQQEHTCADLTPSAFAAVAAPAAQHRHGSSGQSLVELVMIVPVLLLIVLVAIDFGRIYLGFINLQQMARVAGGYAADNASAWKMPQNAAKLADYQDLVANDAAAINCELPKVAGKIHVPDPAFPAGFDMGDPAEIVIPCNFDILTPIISQILGGKLPITATNTYPVREGVVATIPGGGGPILLAPVADFVGTPQSGYGLTTASPYGPLDVTFTDLSKNGPTSWQWNFGDGNGDVFTQGPAHRALRVRQGAWRGVQVRGLARGRQLGRLRYRDEDRLHHGRPCRPTRARSPSSRSRPRSGVEPLNVQFAFVDKQTPAVTYSKYEWDFDGSGTWVTGRADRQPHLPDARRVQRQPAGHRGRHRRHGHPDEERLRHRRQEALHGPRLREQEEERRAGDLEHGRLLDHGQLPARAAEGQPDYKIQHQSIVGGVIDPQPNGCASTITVGP